MKPQNAGWPLRTYIQPTVPPAGQTGVRCVVRVRRRTDPASRVNPPPSGMCLRDRELRRRRKTPSRARAGRASSFPILRCRRLDVDAEAFPSRPSPPAQGCELICARRGGIDRLESVPLYFFKLHLHLPQRDKTQNDLQTRRSSVLFRILVAQVAFWPTRPPAAPAIVTLTVGSSLY